MSSPACGAGLCSASSSAHSIEPLEQSLQFKSGAVYSGNVKKGTKTRCGEGTFSWPSGLQYTGQFRNNKRHGTGVHVWPDGSRYEGGFEEDMRHGRGKHSWRNGEEYEGGYLCDKKQGHGRYTWPSGAFFCGYFERDLREGAGIYVSPDGEKFEGVYHSDHRDGEGVLTYPGGRQDVGVWKGVKLVRLRFAVTETHFDPSSLSHLCSPDSSLGTADYKSRGKFGPKGPLEMSSEALLQAAASGSVAKVDAILKAGAVHIDVVDKMGHTALLGAAIHCQTAVVHLLLDNGADVNLLDDLGVSALNACFHILYSPLPEVQSFLSHLPSLKSCPAVSCSSSPTTFTERTLHTCDLFSTTPGITGGDHPPSSSPLTLFDPRRCAINHLNASSLRSNDLQLSKHKPGNHFSKEKDFLKSKSLGALLVTHQLAIRALPEAKSFPALPSASEDEKKVRFTPLLAIRGEGEVKMERHALGGEEAKLSKEEILKPAAPEMASPASVISTALLPLTTPRLEPHSALSTGLGFGSIMNAEQLPATASAAGDILGVSALSGDYYSTSVPPEGDSRFSMLSQLSNILPDEFDNESVTSVTRPFPHSPCSPGSEGGENQLENGEDPLTCSTPNITPPPATRTHHGNGLLPPHPLTPLSKSSLHDSLVEGGERRSSLFSSPQYGSIVSAAQSTSLSLAVSEQLDSLVSLTPPPSPTEERQLVPLSTLTDSINLLLQRGADPNICQFPMPPLFYAIRAGDLGAVKRLLENGASTEQCLPLEVGGRYPLHTAVTCLTLSSVDIVSALLEHGADPNCEEDSPTKTHSHSSLSEEREEEEERKMGEERSEEGGLIRSKEGVGEVRVTFHIGDEGGGEGNIAVANGNEDRGKDKVPIPVVMAGENEGRASYTPLHLVCSMDGSNSTLVHSSLTSQQEVALMLVAMVKLLVTHGAEVNRVAQGHSPLSLAIVNGHDQVVDVLLESGADPNQPLGRGVATALCALNTHQALKKRDFPSSLALVSKLMRHKADILQAVLVSENEDPGMVTDFALASFKLDRRLACLKYHSLTKSERSRYRAAKRLQQHFVNIFKCLALQTIATKEESWQNIHKKELQSLPVIELPVLVRHKLCRTTSSLFDSRIQPDMKNTKKLKRGRSILSAGERPRNCQGVLSVSLPEHTLRSALEGVAKVQSSQVREGQEDSDDEQSWDGTKQKGKVGTKNELSSEQNIMKLDEMFERAKSLLPSSASQGLSKYEEDGREDKFYGEKKEWTIFSFCYECGRTVGVHLVKCPGCRGVSYCSRSCRTDNWKRGHQKECTGVQVKGQDALTGRGRGVALPRLKNIKRTNSSMM